MSSNQTSGETNSDAADDNAGSSLLEVTWILTAISLMVLGIRLVTSIKIYKKLFVADALMILAAVTAVASSVFISIEISNGLLDPPTSLSFQEAQALVLAEAWAVIFAMISPTLGRISFAVWMLRLANRRSMKLVLYACILVTAISNFGVAIAFCVGCKPFNIGTDLDRYSKCWAKQSAFRVGYMQAAINTFVDLILSIVPGIYVIRLKMELRMKVCIAALLGVSILAAGASLAKCIEMRHFKAEAVYGRPAIIRSVIWNVIEMNIVIITASLPAIRPLLTLGRRRKSTSTDRARLQTPMTQEPKSPYVTSWTGYTECPFNTMGQGPINERLLGNSITIEAGARNGDKKLHGSWYKNGQDFSRIDVGPFVHTSGRPV